MPAKKAAAKVEEAVIDPKPKAKAAAASKKVSDVEADDKPKRGRKPKAEAEAPKTKKPALAEDDELLADIEEELEGEVVRFLY